MKPYYYLESTALLNFMLMDYIKMADTIVLSEDVVTIVRSTNRQRFNEIVRIISNTRESILYSNQRVFPNGKTIWFVNESQLEKIKVKNKVFNVTDDHFTWVKGIKKGEKCVTFYEWKEKLKKCEHVT